MDQDQDHSKKSDGPTKKRRKLDDDANDNIHNHSLRRGMNKSISPPPLRRRRIESPKQVVTEEMGSLKREGESDTQLATNSKLIGVEYLKQSIAEGPKQVVAEKVESLESVGKSDTQLAMNAKLTELENLKQRVVESPKQKVVKSPFQLTSIRDLPASSNLDTVSLKDILGDPLISECWEFNYLHNLDFLMEQFAEDIRNLVKVNVIHGFWKREDQSRLYLMEQALKYPNINLLTAYMPEMFGTHHSKMFILFRHDSTAQVIIHTANMIPFDWTNMTQAMWKSPLLPLLDTEKPSLTDSTEMGSGGKFKLDLLNYLRAYDTKRIICKPLIEQLSQHDFSEIRAALVASVPGKQNIELGSSKTAWGWAGLTKILRSVPCSRTQPEIAVQISSIASLGPTDKWLNQTFFKALGTSRSPTSKPTFKIIFPTADEVRRSLNGYASGNAIHTKILTPAQGKQLSYLKPMLCHWAGDGPQHQISSPQPPDATFNSNTNSQPQQPNQNAHRKRAAPHIKTYIRFSSSSLKSIDWMLVTSANLSKQAWGENTNVAGEVRICSYEIGVLVWPSLWEEEASMVPCFGTDTPLATLDLQTACEGEETNDNGKRVEGNRENEGNTTQNEAMLIGVRMPYDLPIISYAKNDTPWCATASYTEPDWMGQTWNT